MRTRRTSQHYDVERGRTDSTSSTDTIDNAVNVACATSNADMEARDASWTRLFYKFIHNVSTLTQYHDAGF